jgi:anti-sigma factor RsiW
MHTQSDEALVAYLDGELGDAECRQVEAWLAANPAARERMAALAQSAELLREAWAEILDEPVPERLIAAARGARPAEDTPARDAEVLVLRPRAGRNSRSPGPIWHRGVGIAAAAALCGLMIGSGGTYLGLRLLPAGQAGTDQQLATEANNIWLDNAAGYYKLTVSADNLLIDVPASNDANAALQKISQRLPQQVRAPDLKPWGLTFRGARLVVAEGRPAAELVYVTDNKAIGPLSLVIGATKLPDISPTIDHRAGVNLLYWRHHGRAYALVGHADVGYLWGIANDIAWQLDAI